MVMSTSVIQAVKYSTSVIIDAIRKVRNFECEDLGEEGGRKVPLTCSHKHDRCVHFQASFMN
jgi:hypothetical protein